MYPLELFPRSIYPQREEKLNIELSYNNHTWYKIF